MVQLSLTMSSISNNFEAEPWNQHYLSKRESSLLGNHRGDLTGANKGAYQNGSAGFNFIPLFVYVEKGAFGDMVSKIFLKPKQP